MRTCGVMNEAALKKTTTAEDRDGSDAFMMRLTSIFWASNDGLKLDLMTTLTSSLVRPTSLTRGMTRNGRMMSLVVRYLPQGKTMAPFTLFFNICETDLASQGALADLMSSYSPSGGMKLMLRSRSNLLRRTHWWNVQSSMAMDCFPLLRDKHRNRENELTSLSLRFEI